ncbi:extensin family protein [Aquamicrobium segne]|uniref:Extensin family protein n=1 Tax=Aquamicrobium segne TaxID=469547 RepID=A0ABW0GXV0_9HYPH
MAGRFPHSADGICALRRRVRLLATAAALVMLASVSACNTGSVLNLQPAIDVGSTATIPTVSSLPVTAPEASLQAPATLDPYVTAAYPRFDLPLSLPSQLPASEEACRKELKRLRVAYTDIDPIRDGGQCGIDHPVKVTAIGKIEMKPAATLTCAMAASFATWTSDELNPAARLRYLSGVRSIRQGSSYSCRKIRGEGVLSEHGKGNALDVMAIELNNGKVIDVRKPGLFAFRERGLLNTVRADGCSYFTTVLGPGYDHDHRDHFHFDIKTRKNGYRACR